MDYFGCSNTATDNQTDLNSILISMNDMKAESMNSDMLCCDTELLNEKDISSDLTNLDNLDILNDGTDVFPNANAIMDCLNQSPEPFELPAIDTDESVLPVFGPYTEFESSTNYQADVLDPNAVPGVCGLRNLGNTCFMNAGLQCLLNNKTFKTYFGEANIDNFSEGTLSLKFAETMKKAWSGNYSSIHLGEFKDCFGSMYNQFRNFRQHDCQEFLALLLDTMHEELNTATKCKVKKKIDIAPTNNTIPNSSLDPTTSVKLELKLDCEKDMEVCDTKEEEECKGKDNEPDAAIKCEVYSPNPVEMCEVAMDVDSAANNTIPATNVTSSVKVKIETETSSSVYDRNTEKMADLLINNKLDTILNKNELDISSSNEHQSNCDSKRNSIKKNSIKNVNDVNENNLEKNELASKLNSVHKIPSIEDFVKDTKTLNTNVLVSDETNNLFKFDSEKFPKHDSNRLQETVDNLGQMVDLGTKQGGIKRVKITNIIHEKHGILEQSSDQFSSCSTLHKRQKIENIDANLDSPIPEQDETVDIEQLPCDEYSESSSQSSELYPLNSECQELLVAEEVRRAYSDWDQYKSLNQSIVVDTFHGQFRSSVVCSQCSHNSITYEPFMYLPVFLPHTLERQIVITFVQNNGAPPVCYLVNVNKFDRIHKIREALQILLDVPAEEIILAECFENHISRFLDENQSIRRVNDSTRSVYAFEVGKICEENSDPMKSTNAEDIGSLCAEDKHFNKSNMTTKLSDDSLLKNSIDEDIFETFDPSQIRSTSPNEKRDNILLTTEFLENSSSEFTHGSTQNENCPLGPIQFHTCAICLEELPNYKLSFHPSCECILCNSCIEVSCKHYGGATFICPVCSSPVAPAEDFMPLTKIGETQYKISTIPIPIVMRHDIFEEGVLKQKVLIGHPCLLKLPSSLPASKLYEHVDRAIPFLSTYSLLLVDGQGKNCSRCLYNKHCSGCEITRIGDIKLHPGDNIAVRYVDLTAENIASASYAVEHKSMQQTRHKSELDIYDCLEYFSERESLDADSPWFCPVCRRNQQATKSLSVWKFPQVLIIYLKRFVFHDFMSIKVEDKVSYPLEGLDLSSFSSGPFSEDLMYDLQSCVCHFGGVSAGHYTSYSKHATSNEWYYYNDENVKKEAPNTEECVNEYIFFYQKR
ncbi:ubiquitin carboxyl-terminal hydrolase 11 isoform X3 [Parasteatoda tepidariorum]|nr:uncharacterized protein LOC107449010 isoform X2 [Parasteatoda tepidariorum]XP_042906806.1 uncharacterized protein LOC107449010 isoform X2 [Parasteatoda tepidariorum]